jgi:hypothetical protein
VKLTASEMLAKAKADAKRNVELDRIGADKAAKSAEEFESKAERIRLSAATDRTVESMSGNWVEAKRRLGSLSNKWVVFSEKEWLGMPQEERAKYMFKRDVRPGNLYPLSGHPNTGRGRGTRVVGALNPPNRYRY